MSIRVAISSVNEKVNANGSSSLPRQDEVEQNVSELESLLEQHSATFGLPLEKAVETIVAVSEQRRTLEVLFMIMIMMVMFINLIFFNHEEDNN